MKCDDCEHYSWYYDYCNKWKCIVDAREVHDCFEKKEGDKVTGINEFSSPTQQKGSGRD